MSMIASNRAVARIIDWQTPPANIDDPVRAAASACSTTAGAHATGATACSSACRLRRGCGAESAAAEAPAVHPAGGVASFFVAIEAVPELASFPGHAAHVVRPLAVVEDGVRDLS